MTHTHTEWTSPTSPPCGCRSHHWPRTGAYVTALTHTYLMWAMGRGCVCVFRGHLKAQQTGHTDTLPPGWAGGSKSERRERTHSSEHTNKQAGMCISCGYSLPATCTHVQPRPPTADHDSQQSGQREKTLLFLGFFLWPQAHWDSWLLSLGGGLIRHVALSAQ